MKESDNKKPFFDLNGLINPEEFIAAAETEDELGCVLRMHLCLERFLDEFAEKIIPDKDKKYHLSRPQFGGKLSLAVAYGLCSHIAESIYVINKIRNDFAHGRGFSISKQDNLKIADEVDKIIILPGENQPPVRQRWIELCKVRPGEKLGFGMHGERIDFVIACSELLRRASLWIVVFYIQLNPHLTELPNRKPR